jgi:hypothetical protein
MPPRTDIHLIDALRFQFSRCNAVTIAQSPRRRMMAGRSVSAAYGGYSADLGGFSRWSTAFMIKIRFGHKSGHVCQIAFQTRDIVVMHSTLMILLHTYIIDFPYIIVILLLFNSTPRLFSGRPHNKRQ